MNMIQRINAVEPHNLVATVKKLRNEYKALYVFDQAEKHEHYKSLCESEGIDIYLIMCDDVHFKYLDKNNLIERF